MNTQQLRRSSGQALVLAAIGCIVGGLMHPVVHGEAHSVAALTAPHEALGSLILLVGTVLLLLGLPGVYGWLAPRLGTLGLIGFLLYFLGNLLSAVPHLILMAFVAPTIARRAPDLVSHNDMIIDSHAFATEQMLTGLTLVAGLLVLSVALVRAAGALRWIGTVGIVGTVVILIPLPAHPVLSGLQIEAARGLLVAALGVMAVRTAHEPLAVPTTELARPAVRKAAS